MEMLGHFSVGILPMSVWVDDLIVLARDLATFGSHFEFKLRANTELLTTICAPTIGCLLSAPNLLIH